jgi:hypothetical protein
MMNMVHALMHTVQRLTMLHGGSAFGFCLSARGPECGQITCAPCTRPVAPGYPAGRRFMNSMVCWSGPTAAHDDRSSYVIR